VNSRPYNNEVENGDYIFLSNSSNARPLTRARVEEIFRNISNISKIKVTPHYLRHTHITELIEAGFDTAFVQKRVGHSCVASTEKYVHLNLNAQKEAYIRFYKRINYE